MAEGAAASSTAVNVGEPAALLPSAGQSIAEAPHIGSTSTSAADTGVPDEPAAGTEAPGPASADAASPPSTSAASWLAGGAGPAAADLLRHLRQAVGAELEKGLSEHRLLQACNEAATARYQQLAGAAVAAQRLEGLQQQQAATLLPALEVLAELEVQVGELEGIVAHMDASSRRLEASLH